jgi:CheY-like chemotaxis protein
MGHLRGSSSKRGVRIPDSYSDVEAFSMAAWNKPEDSPVGKVKSLAHSVLVVDDDPEQLKFLKKIVERAGFKVIASESAAQALDVLSEKDVDIIVSDYKMPEMDGFEFLQALRSMDKDFAAGDIPVIMLTACGDDLEFVALERGADMFCEKFRAESLLVKQINFLLEM